MSEDTDVTVSECDAAAAELRAAVDAIIERQADTDAPRRRTEADWTDEEAEAHGRAWVDAGWTWTSGQVVIVYGLEGIRWVIVRVRGRELDITQLGRTRSNTATPGASLTVDVRCAGVRIVPDMRDPGTRGHALDQVRMVFGDRHISVDWHGLGTDEWETWSSDRVLAVDGNGGPDPTPSSKRPTFMGYGGIVCRSATESEALLVSYQAAQSSSK